MKRYEVKTNNVIWRTGDTTPRQDGSYYILRGFDMNELDLDYMSFVKGYGWSAYRKEDGTVKPGWDNADGYIKFWTYDLPIEVVEVEDTEA